MGDPGSTFAGDADAVFDKAKLYDPGRGAERRDAAGAPLAPSSVSVARDVRFNPAKLASGRQLS